jgi:hypothetical protein
MTEEKSKKSKFKKTQGLDVGKAQNRQCQHLGPDFRQLSTGKKHRVILRNFREKE